MPNQNLLEEGLAILSQCKQETGDIWHAHYGAAAIAGYFFAQEHEGDGILSQAIVSQTEAMLNKHGTASLYVNSERCEPAYAESTILAALEQTIDELHWVGHNVIYSAVSLIAIRELQGWGTEEQISGLSELVLSFRKTIPGRSWIGYSVAEVKRLDLSSMDQLQLPREPKELSAYVLEQLAAFSIIYEAESHHDLIGHMLTFSHALNLLYDMGHRSFFQRGQLPLRRLVNVLQASHHLKPGEAIKLYSAVDRIPLEPAERSEYLPTELGYWEKGRSKNEWDFGHAFKFPFSFYDHLKRAGSDEARFIEKFRYIIGR
ncbi:hypothetical protein FHS16_000971 [Paenibacillus endophyticus]|uniref:Uncharacterized protein n=1 Tax=Paenibacillus endophyticus TaxID=1294268 RepID=A0A7W5C4W0_9BACL|nr:hypothetical protein [Paenibacillus endophyticus]MBB3150937.1 hypothetical protein [Paenibacillus endophyticus]